jgi:hypothetical protein
MEWNLRGTKMAKFLHPLKHHDAICLFENVAGGVSPLNFRLYTHIFDISATMKNDLERVVLS